MASPNINIWFRADITLKHLQDQTSKVITVTSRPLRGENPHETFPILDSIDGLGLAAGQSGMPTSSTGSITLTDTFESFGAERRFFDLLERYTPIEQTVQVYAAQTALDDNAAYSDFVSVWKGKCKSVSKSDNLILEVEAQIFETRYVTTKIGSTFTRNGTIANVPNQSIGKNVPLIMGSSVQVPAYPLNDSTYDAFDCWHYYGVNLGTSFEIGSSGVQKYYAKCNDGVYRRVYSNATARVAGFGSNISTGSNYPTPQGLTERGVDVKISGSEYYIIVGGYWWFKGQNNGAITPTGHIVFNLYIANEAGTSIDTEPVAKAVIDKADYLTEVRGASDFAINFYFDKMVVFGEGMLPPRISMVLDNYDTSVTDFVDGGVNAVGEEYFTKLSNNEWAPSATGAKPYCQLRTVSFTDGTGATDGGAAAIIPSDGIRPIGFQSLMYDIGNTDYAELSDLDLIVETNGILDNGSGSITGSASSIIKYPNHILKLMGYTWNGSAWVDSGNYDFSQFASLYSSTFAAGQTYSRYISGATEGEQTLEDLLSSVMDQSASKLVQLTNGKLTIWPWGISQAVSRVFTDENSSVISWKRLDSGSIVNQVKISYAKSLINAAANDLGAGGNSFNFGALLDWTVTSYPLINMLVEDSQAIYGKKPPSETELNLVNDSTSAETYGYSLLRQFDHPHTLAQISVDFWKNRDLELMQIIELVNPKMPGYLGTSSRARLPTYDGNDVQVSRGDYWKRATRYRCQIISREISWGRSSLPSLVFGLRVITPYHLNDPT